MRRYCRKHRLAFTTSFHTRFPDYVSARAPIPEAWVWATLRWFHGASSAVLAATPALASELRARGFANVVLWPRGVDTGLFRPRERRSLPAEAGVPVGVGRVAVEKNLEAFLDLDLPGTKVIVGDGPAREGLAHAYPNAVFLGRVAGRGAGPGLCRGRRLRVPEPHRHLRPGAAGSLASGLPVAAFPVAGPRDVIGTAPVGVLSEDLRAACLAALEIPRQACTAFAAGHTWEACAQAFVDEMVDIRAIGPDPDPVDFLPVPQHPSCVA